MHIKWMQLWPVIHLSRKIILKIKLNYKDENIFYFSKYNGNIFLFNET